MSIKALVPRPHEHLYSYLIRICTYNGFASLPEMYAYFGMGEEFQEKSSAFLNNSKCLRLLADSLGIDEDLFINLLPKSNKNIANYLNHSAPTDLLRHNNFRCCPKCLLEDCYIPAYQSFRPITFRAKHSCAIVDKWRDGNYIDWNAHNLFERVSSAEYLEEEITLQEQNLAQKLYLLLQRRFINDLPQVFGMMDTSNFLLLYLFYFKHCFREDSKSDSLFWLESYQNIFSYPYAVFDFIDTFHELELQLSFKEFSAIYPDIYRDLYLGNYSSSYAYMKLKVLLENQLLVAQ